MVLKQENYITPDEFERFLSIIPQVLPGKRVKTNDFIMAARIQYGCALRVSELLSLTPEDFDLNNLVLTLRKTKTGFKKCKCSQWGKRKLIYADPNCIKCKGKGKVRKPQFTTILPNDANGIRDFLKNKKAKKPIFNFTRITVWHYYKKCGLAAGLDIREQQDMKKIEGVWTHLIRKSRAKLMKQKGADMDLIKVKLRHSLDTTERYTKPDIAYLKMWEAQNL